jgi:two-component system, LuxR family, response regulator FixJ
LYAEANTEADRDPLAQRQLSWIKELSAEEGFCTPAGVNRARSCQELSMPHSAVEARSLAIVDDDPGALTGLAFLLEVEGYRTRTFKSGREFLDVAAGDLPDCLIIDQNMPSMTGLEVIDRLRQAGRSLPIIMITATPSAGLSRMAEAAGVNCIVEKPIFGSELSEAIRKCLGDQSQCCSQ